jgi:hypothetical protein
MRRVSGRWLGIGIAVLVVGAFALFISGPGAQPVPAGTSLAPMTEADPAITPVIQPVPGLSGDAMVGLVFKVGIVAALLGGSPGCCAAMPARARAPAAVRARWRWSIRSRSRRDACSICSTWATGR